MGYQYKNFIRANRYELSHKKRLCYIVNCITYTRGLISNNVAELALAHMSMQDIKNIYRVGYLKVQSNVPDEPWRGKLAVTPDDYTEQVLRLVNMDKLKRILYQEVINILLMRFEKITGSKREGMLENKIRELAQMFGLNETEQEVLLFLYLLGSDAEIDRLHDELFTYLGVRQHYHGRRNIQPIHIITRLPINDIEAAFSNQSALVKSGLIDEEFDLAGEVFAWMQNSHCKPISEQYYTEFLGVAIPLSRHIVELRHINTLIQLIKHKSSDRGINILLYGEAGTGKTEFARSLFRSLNIRIYEIKNGGEISDNEKQLNLFRYRALIACHNRIDRNKTAIVFDEADNFLNYSDKGLINHIIDNSKIPIIWISNRYDGIDPSIKRRFDYSICFSKATHNQRKKIWQHSVEKHSVNKLFTKEEIDSLAEKFETNAGGIDIVLRNVANFSSKIGSKKAIMETVENILQAHRKILNDDDSVVNATAANAPTYALEGLNIHGNVSEALTIITRFNEYWANDSIQIPIKNMNILLSGPPGSGKTEFAKHIARTTSRRLLVRRASDLMDKYVGGTEKLIKAAFSEAEKDKVLLFIDEADSFFWSRESASRSWEVTQVNEILTQMETFRGMLICSTNFRNLLDSAALRRFNIKLEFDYLDSTGNNIFYTRFFKKLIALTMSSKEMAELSTLSYLTPGDFKVVFQKYSFFNKGDITHSKLLSALKSEVAIKNNNLGKKMGF